MSRSLSLLASPLVYPSLSTEMDADINLDDDGIRMLSLGEIIILTKRDSPLTLRAYVPRRGRHSHISTNSHSRRVYVSTSMGKGRAWHSPLPVFSHNYRSWYWGVRR